MKFKIIFKITIKKSKSTLSRLYGIFKGMLLENESQTLAYTQNVSVLKKKVQLKPNFC